MPMLDRRIKIFQISRRTNMKVRKKRRIDPYLKCLLQRRVHCKNPSQRKHVTLWVTLLTPDEPTQNPEPKTPKAKPKSERSRRRSEIVKRSKLYRWSGAKTLTLVQEASELLDGGGVAGGGCHCRRWGDPEPGPRARTDEAGAAWFSFHDLARI
jgi:hypothetical protein